MHVEGLYIYVHCTSVIVMSTNCLCMYYELMSDLHILRALIV